MRDFFRGEEGGLVRLIAGNKGDFGNVGTWGVLGNMQIRVCEWEGKVERETHTHRERQRKRKEKVNNSMYGRNGSYIRRVAR